VAASSSDVHAGDDDFSYRATPLCGTQLLSPSAKYEIWLRLVRGEATIAQAATEAGVDRSTIIRVRQVAKDGALAALAASRPGTPGKSPRDIELEEANAEIARLSEAVKELAVKLTLVEGKGGSV
jgi:transposase-like protein